MVFLGLKRTSMRKNCGCLFRSVSISLRLCLRATKMSHSTWYYNVNALNRKDKYAEIKSKISEVYHHNKGCYGYRSITVSLRKQGYHVNHKTIQRLMAEQSLRH
ncbi:hypothetical protein C6H68_09995 [Photorhabdus luminescens]|uniref:HTH-like domain-containing protein n=1 Tax=Photorhabdus laumondii subsp. clarkei TaxID=2029685 RepID=A0A329VI39_9GAMM|nr:hypothetical protein C6H68_09995 [Photorhabdus luminescens]RAW91588.1 hypothetical protein CKY01_08560 [Photorhabdus laumondii subsp. clarkei]